MKDSDALLDRPPAVAIRTIALALLDEAGAAAARLGDEADAEALHDFRVALRRLRTLVKAYWEHLADSLTRKHAIGLRNLARSTGGARDSEVQLAWLAERQAGLSPIALPAAAWLSGRLQTRVREGYLVVRTGAVERFAELERKLRRALAHYEAKLVPDAAGQRFAFTVGEKVRSVSAELRVALEAIASAFDVEGAHQARILAKRLRYLLEPLKKTSLGTEVGAAIATLKGLQELLGQLHDVHVLASEVSIGLVDATAERALQNRAAGLPAEDPRPGLLQIEALVSEGIEALFTQLQAEWLADRLPSFSNQIEALAAALGARPPSLLEIERKYLLLRLPEVAVAPLQIEQGWIPGTRLKERLRRVKEGQSERYYRTVKLGSGLQRIELEEETSKEIFEQLWSLTAGHRVVKRRYRIPEGDRVWELDQFDDRELVVAEIELASADEEVQVPTWLQPHLVREVTGDAAYSNEKLAK